MVVDLSLLGDISFAGVLAAAHQSEQHKDALSNDCPANSHIASPFVVFQRKLLLSVCELTKNSGS